ncbi:unnamed protein product [Tilletia controversa]|uniref:Uncharacterized protein n=1 Tax=Tilletia controversa TaxID=13291 RepID=A0A8X7MIL9_9BASI|nr:hypothetical protein CF328_g8900 [Tilletia controversa]KAE8237373.1 hypothetical protein A4X06_0g9249 [Tilletia controversa]CAD6906683.1 unnamed protein product [Tilletia controversa]CAD6953760.1 unnamed protein product [Tilletia controversa]
MSSADEYDAQDDGYSDDYADYSDGGFSEDACSPDDDDEPAYEETGVDERYDDGYEAGYDDGYEDGHEQGYEDGYDQGYEDGHNDGQVSDDGDDYISAGDSRDEPECDLDYDDELEGQAASDTDRATDAAESREDDHQDIDSSSGSSDGGGCFDWQPRAYRYEEKTTLRADQDTPRRQFNTHLRQMWPAFPDVDPRLIRMTDRPWSGSLLAAPFTLGRAPADSDWNPESASHLRLRHGYVLPRSQLSQLPASPPQSISHVPVRYRSRHPRVSFGETTHVPPSDIPSRPSSIASSRVSISRSELGEILSRLSSLETRLAFAEGTSSHRASRARLSVSLLHPGYRSPSHSFSTLSEYFFFDAVRTFNIIRKPSNKALAFAAGLTLAALADEGLFVGGRYCNKTTSPAPSLTP